MSDPSSEGGTARPGDRWRRLLAASALPPDIVERSPEPGATLEPERFRWKPEEDAEQPVRPSRRRALEALPEGGTVLDVGCGGGASSLGLVPRPGVIIGVDAIAGMLESFTESAAVAGVAVRTVLGTWPAVASDAEVADVAVCHHAIYRCEEVEAFVGALTRHARHRVVIEVSARSPLSGLDPLWKSFHGIERPDPLVGDELQAVLEATGVPAEREDIVLPPRRQEIDEALVAFVRRRLHVGPERDAEIEEHLRTREVPDHKVVCLFWPGAARSVVTRELGGTTAPVSIHGVHVLDRDRGPCGRSATERVEMACGRGIGRMDTARPAVAVLEGTPSADAISPVRAHTCDGRAVETTWPRRRARRSGPQVAVKVQE